MMRFAIFALAFALPLIAQVHPRAAPKAPNPKALENVRVQVVRVLPDAAVVDVMDPRRAGSRVVFDLSGRLVILESGPKAAVGDRFDVWARETGTRDYEGQPLRKYTVTKSQRI